MLNITRIIKARILFKIFAVILSVLFIYSAIMIFLISDFITHEMKVVIIGMSIFGFLATAIVIILLLQKLLNPIDKLAKTIIETKQGNFDVRTYIDRDDEFGLLADEFNHLLDIIQNEMKKLNKRIDNKTKTLEIINKNLSDSINVAATIQNAILPPKDRFESIADDYFIHYEPKDIVSGDIYLVRRLSEQESILIIADSTGHGVSGAFITMLIKAIERELLIFIKDNKNISTSKILNIFNNRMKELLNQHSKDSTTISDVGFDGAVLYINRKESFAQYSGANTPIFISQNNKIKIIKPDKFSIGYKKSTCNFEFCEHFIDLTNSQIIYITTDGFIDQLGGEKGFPFAKRRFIDLIQKYHNESLSEQKLLFKKAIKEYQKSYENTDDRTVIALKFNQKTSCEI
jgi:serine phosphatase RsbU (regulator of sigma subunit)